VWLRGRKRRLVRGKVGLFTEPKKGAKEKSAHGGRSVSSGVGKLKSKPPLDNKLRSNSQEKSWISHGVGRRRNDENNDEKKRRTSNVHNLWWGQRIRIRSPIPLRGGKNSYAIQKETTPAWKKRKQPKPIKKRAVPHVKYKWGKSFGRIRRSSGRLQENGSP